MAFQKRLRLTRMAEKENTISPIRSEESRRDPITQFLSLFVPTCLNLCCWLVVRLANRLDL